MVGQGRTVAEESKVESIREQTYYRWKKQYAGMDELKSKAVQRVGARERATQEVGSG